MFSYSIRYHRLVGELEKTENAVHDSSVLGEEQEYAIQQHLSREDGTGSVMLYRLKAKFLQLIVEYHRN